MKRESERERDRESKTEGEERQNTIKPKISTA